MKARKRGLRETCLIGFGTAIATLLHRQKAMRDETVDAKSRLQLALDEAQCGTFEWNAASGRHVWDSRTEKLFGFDPGAFPQAREAFISRIHPEDRRRVLATADNAFSKRQDLHHEYRVLLSNGETR